MSMGIVLHAAWIMIPEDSGAPMADASASWEMQFLCLGIHTFRMQLFFVLAGLFACLLLRKRGLKSFIRNRTTRIVFPLIAFWIVLCPIIIWQYNAAGIASGAIQSEKTAWELTKAYFAGLSPSNVMLLHLWFLYYLCWTYLFVLAARGLFSLVDRNQFIRVRISQWAGQILTKSWSVLLLAGFFATMLIPMKGTWGVNIVPDSLYWEWPGMATYVAYFVVGWLIFRNVDKLGEIIQRWRWQLALGLLLIVPYYYYSSFASHSGYATWKYPSLTVNDFYFEDDEPRYAAFRERLISAPTDSVAGSLWMQLPEDYQDFVRQQESMTQNQLNGLLGAINKTILGESELTRDLDLSGIALTPESQAILALPATERTPEQNQRLNREILDVEFAGIIYSEDVNRPHYYLFRTIYAFGYSLITWLLIFGCIGFSQHYFDSESRFWRYFSDASYWFYLAHIPVQFQILLWWGHEPWHWTTKFTFYVVGTIAVLLPTYHFLVRPTWIGYFLNGRMASVWPKRRVESVQPAGPAAADGGWRIDSAEGTAAEPMRRQSVEEDVPETASEAEEDKSIA
jgi:hypothetical protein